METYREKDYKTVGITSNFVQDNHSGSIQNVLRGLHYQIKQPQGKLVRAVRGEIFDVAVDMRRLSPTYGHWVGVILSEENRLQLWVPVGFAHGYYVLSDWAELIYKATDYYAPEWERTLLWNDPALGIIWPFMENDQPILSTKDSIGKLLQEAEIFEK